jgi:nucleotide-binding universal stress UspA family protein
MYKKILLAVDGSEHSMRSTAEAIKIASLCADCMVEVVYVADFSKAKNEILHAQTKEELELSRRKKFLPYEELLKGNNLMYKVVILHGDPGPTIVEYGNKGDFDLVVVGSKGKGHSSLQELVLGSVSHKVVKRMDCPVLLVK